MKNLIKVFVNRNSKWLWIALFILIFLSGIGFIIKAFQSISDFEKAMVIVIGIFMVICGGYGILHNIFGEKKTEDIVSWIFGIIVAALAAAFFGTLIISGIVSLFKVIF